MQSQEEMSLMEPSNNYKPMTPPKNKMMTPNQLKNFNRLAALVHVLLFYLVWSGAKTRLDYNLFVDATYYAGSNGTETVYMTGLAICDFAPPNSFSPSKDLTLQITTYPQETSFWLSLNNLILAFFALSAVFQGVFVELYPKVPTWLIGYGKEQSENIAPRKHLYNEMFDEDDIHARMTINFMRYIEYSISASIMVVVISILSGMANGEILAYTATLSFACMILGWIAEFCMRLSKVIDSWEIQSNVAHRSLPVMCKTIALVSHILSWICIVVPWIFIFARYNAFFDTAGGCPGRGDKMTPPDWLRWVFYGQGLFFLAFGLVQVYQFRNPDERMKPEVMYIALSIGAKALLGMSVSANLFLGN